VSGIGVGGFFVGFYADAVRIFAGRIFAGRIFHVRNFDVRFGGFTRVLIRDRLVGKRGKAAAKGSAHKFRELDCMVSVFRL